MNKKTALLVYEAKNQELARLVDLLSEVQDDTGEIAPSWLVHYVGGRRESLAAHIAALKSDNF